MQKAKQKHTSNPFGGFLGYLVSFAVLVIVAVYLGYHFLSSFGTELATEHAMPVTENDVMEFDAYIMRSETVLNATAGGGVGYNFTDGSKIRVGAEVASIYSGSSGTDTRGEIIALDDKIELLKESNDISGLAASDTSTIDNRTKEYYVTIRKSAEEAVYDNLPKRRDELLTLINKRQVITGRIENFDSVIDNLTAERDSLTASLDNIKETVTSPVSGFFYSSLDGYESIFTADAAQKMSLASFDKMLSADPVRYAQTAIGKVATDFRWYIVTETTRDDLRYYNEGYTYNIIFPYNNDTTLKMKLDDIVAPDGQTRVLLVFGTNEVPEDFSFRRMQPIEIVRNSYTGYRIPISAVRLLDGRMGVYILEGNTVYFRYIDVLLESDGYYIVAPRDPENDEDYKTKLGLYDLVITAGKDLEVGKIIT